CRYLQSGKPHLDAAEAIEERRQKDDVIAVLFEPDREFLVKLERGIARDIGDADPVDRDRAAGARYAVELERNDTHLDTVRHRIVRGPHASRRKRQGRANANE